MRLIILSMLLLSATLPISAKANTELVKLGDYRYVYKYLFKLYDAELYAAPNASPNQITTGECHYALRFSYLRTIEKAIILKSAARMLERNLTDQELEQIAERVMAINKAYTSVQKGDHSLLSYHPDRGTTLAINDKEIITIEGADFARLYFRIWLGERPISTQMRDALLGI